MSAQSKELSPISMISEQLSNLHLSESSGFVDAVRSLDVKKYIFGKASALLSYDSQEDKGESKTKSSSSNSSDSVFYAVNIPKNVTFNCEEAGDPSKEALVFEKIEEALKMVKMHKHARFKSFPSKDDAIKFSLQSINSDSCGVSSISLTPSEEEDGLPSVKCQDLVKLRKAIEEGNSQYFLQLVWENARYLINYHGDTPAILHEGFRYNALHIAARSKKPMMCQIILDTLNDPTFFDKIYKGDSKIREEKIHHLLDQYLNNPDKRLGETPLHFAAKFGCLDAVKILLSHPYCIADKKNKYGETPAQTVCTRCSSANETLRQNMEEAFKGLMYVPVLRAENNVIPPCIEKPCTKADIEKKFFSSSQSVNSPNFMVKAFAGPMSPEAANTLYKLWKNPSSTPQRQAYSIDEQKCIHKIRLTDTEKGLERAGRNIAKDLNVEWIEYWPTLNAFVNLASAEGLNTLEKRLSKLYKPFVCAENYINSGEIKNQSPDNNCFEATSFQSFINPLGHYLNFHLKGNLKNEDEDTEDDDVFFTPPSSPESSPRRTRNNTQSSEVQIYVNGTELTRQDIDMFLALRDINVNNQMYPCVTKWMNFIQSKMRFLENKPKSLTPLASLHIPRLKRRENLTCIAPRNLFLSSEEKD